MKKIAILLFALVFNINSYAQHFSWVKIGNGVQYTFTENHSGNNILVVIGGWQAKQEWVNSWAKELYQAKVKDFGVKHILSVKGPDDVCNDKKENDLVKLAEFMKNIIYATYFIDKVIIVAHSSGSFVANELLNILYGKNGIAKDTFYINKVHYFNLDGGIGGGECGVALDDEVIDDIAKLYAVSAYDSASGIYSSNYETIIQLTKMYKQKSELIVVDATESGCKGKWCLHDALIIRKPYNPEMYDLERDYTLFDEEHKVQTDYLNYLK